MSDIVIDAEIQVPTHVTLKYDVEVPFVTLVTQADWNESDSSKKGYIKNKPDLKPVATSGDYDDLDNKPTIPVVPTNVSSFTNDAGYITKDVDDLTNYTKTTNLAEVAISGDYYDLINTPTIPAAQIQSDWTQSDNTKKDFIKNKPSLATVATSGSYNDLTNKPTKLSDFTNDEGFIDNTINNLTNYYTKSDTYTKSEVNNLIHNIISLNIEIVSVLPVSDISTTTIYLVPNTTQTTGNIYDEYIYVNNAWELIGSTQVDLSNYYTKTEVDTALSGKQNTIDSSHKLPASNVSGLANIATSGSYNDLSNTPTIPTNTSDLTNNGSDGTSTYVEASDLATVATSGNFEDLNGTEYIVTLPLRTDVIGNSPRKNRITNLPCFIFREYTESLVETASFSITYIGTFKNGNFTNILDIEKFYRIEFDTGEDVIIEFANSQINSNGMRTTVVATENFLLSVATDSTHSTWLCQSNKLAVSFSVYELTITTPTSSNPHAFTKPRKLPDYFLNDTIARIADLKQPDWNQSDNTKLDFIKNKPSIPTVYDGVTTLQLNGTQIDTFSANQSGNNTINIEAVPTFPTTSNLTTLVAGKLNTLGSVDYETIALPATPGTAEYNGTFTSTTSGDITVSLPLTFWSGDTDIVAGKTYSFSIQNGVGFIIQLD